MSTRLKLNSTEDYETGDNSKIIATDSQKNTVYLLAKKHGVGSIEEFGLLVAKHFLNKYSHIISASVHIEEMAWQRIRSEDGRAHNHAFRFEPSSTRWTWVKIDRNENPTIISGLKNMRVLKTTQSSFVNFIDDEYRSLPDMADRLFSTSAISTWRYHNITRNIPFDKIYASVEQFILKGFAGDPVTGIPSPSVQNTLYLTCQEILAKIPQIDEIEIRMPNIHYNLADLAKFPDVIKGPNDNVFVPTDKPAGNIYLKMSRPNVNSKL